MIGALATGFALVPLALGVYVSYRLFRIVDLTTDGAFGLGIALTVALTAMGVPPALALLPALLLGALAGAGTAWLNVRRGVPLFLAGVLTMVVLHAFSARIVGMSQPVSGQTADGCALAAILPCVVALLAGGLLYWFLRTHMGTGLRAAGANSPACRSLGIEPGTLTILGLAVANALAGVSGALFANYCGPHGPTGMIVWGLAAVMIGVHLARKRGLPGELLGAGLAVLVLRAILSVPLQAGMTETDMKLVVALVVVLALGCGCRRKSSASTEATDA